MKKIILLAVAAIASLTVNAQDIIVTRDGQRIDAKITEVSSSEVRYKEWNNQDGPTFVLRADEMNTIIYQNGTVKTFEHAPAAAAETILPVGYITRDDNNVYILGNRRMSETEYIDFICQNCKPAYDYYQSGVGLWKAGTNLLGVGIGLMLGGVVWVVCGQYAFNDYTYARAFTIGGAVLLGVGGASTLGAIPCMVVGGIRKKRSHEIYNESCAPKQEAMAVTFGLSPAPGGLGLRMNF